MTQERFRATLVSCSTMANLTITVDEHALRKARMRALAQGTSVNAVLAGFLETYAGIRGERGRAIQDLLSLSRRTSAKSGGRRWTRDELHERGS